MAAATLTATKDLFDVETKIGAIKQRNLRMTDDYTKRTVRLKCCCRGSNRT